MFEINKAIKKALAEKGIDVQAEYNKVANKLCKISIPPNKISKRNHIHKGILHKDHLIQKSTRRVNDE
jgi:hypothetical protein